MTFAPALGLLGAGMSAFGSIEGGLASRQSSRYNAQVAANNAALAEQNATYTAHAGQTEATQSSLQSANKLAKIKGQLAANGVDVNSGSAVDVQQSEREAGKLSTEMTKANAQARVYGYRAQEAGYQAQQKIDTAQADNALTGALLGAGGGLLANASAIRTNTPKFANDLSDIFMTM
jgi:hypothetical protein